MADDVDELEEFLAHFGVKGMKWGVRREGDSAGGGGQGDGFLARRRARKDEKASKTLAKSEERAKKEAPPGTIGNSFRPDGTPILVQKNNKGDWEETYLSADAERFMKTHLKDQHSMSNQELKSYLDRANLMKQYDQLAYFNKKDPDANQELKNELERLRATQSIGMIKQQMKGPSKLQRTMQVAAFAGKMTPAFAVFKQLDDMTGNALSGEVKRSLKDAFDSSGSSKTRPARSDKPEKQSTFTDSRRKQKKYRNKGGSTFKVNPNNVTMRPSGYSAQQVLDRGNELAGPSLLALPGGS